MDSLWGFNWNSLRVSFHVGSTLISIRIDMGFTSVSQLFHVSLRFDLDAACDYKGQRDNALPRNLRRNGKERRHRPIVTSGSTGNQPARTQERNSTSSRLGSTAPAILTRKRIHCMTQLLRKLMTNKVYDVNLRRDFRPLFLSIS